MPTKPLAKIFSQFRKVAFWEGISYVALLFIAMPLKYFADMPMAVKLVGWAHGVLFIAYVYFLAKAHFAAKWSLTRSLLLFLASLVPFAAFYAEKSVRREQSELVG